MKRLVSISLVALFLFSGCAWFRAKDEKNSDTLADEGMTYFEEGKYRKSIESFGQLRDWYPFSKYASLAELKIADAYYRLEEYDEAVFTYEEFESLHPRNEAVPYVIFQIGNCYFERMGTVDRDQTVTRKALESYKRLAKQFPDDPYAARAGERIRECQKNLAEHEFRVGLYYYKDKRYEPALARFKTVLAEYPDTGIHQKALQYITLCQQQLEKEQQKEKN